MGTEQFCLKWNNHHSNMLTVFEQLLSNEALVDVTLACEGFSMKAHKMVLSACSPFFQNLFLENPCKHPIVILKDMKYRDLKAIVDFMYRGEVNVSDDQLTALLKTAETLKVKGLAEVMYENKPESPPPDDDMQNIRTQGAPSIGHHKESRTHAISSVRRRHGRSRRHSLSDSIHSDSENHVPTKLQEMDSSQLPEEHSGDVTTDNDFHQRKSGKTSNHRSDLNSSVDAQCNNFRFQMHTMLPSINSKESIPVIEEVRSGDEVEFEVEPSKLMEQTLTENVPVFPNSHCETSAASVVQTVGDASSNTAVHNQQCHISSNGDGSTVVPVSLAAELPTSNIDFAQEDIKPGVLSFEDSQLSSTAGPSHQRDKHNSAVTYVDTSVMSAVAGPSNYNIENSQISVQQHHRQDYYAMKDDSSFHSLQTDFPKFHGKQPKPLQHKKGQKPSCPICLKSFFDCSNLKRHMEIHYYQRKNYVCHVCARRFSWKTHLMTHMRTAHVVQGTSFVPSCYKECVTHKY